MDINTIQKVHFIGIGGIGISSIARMLLMQDKVVTGSDRAESVVTEVLSDAGASITIGSNRDVITEDTDLVIYTIAIPPDDLEFLRAKELDIPVMTYPEALGAYSKDKYTIAVSGTNGKTTTTGMISQIMLEGGLDPSVVVGSFLKGYKSNFIAGKSDYLVVESCEYKRSFLQIHPNILVITNIEEEHLDYYKDIEDIQSAFIEMVKRIPEDGYLVCNPKDPHVRPVVEAAFCQIIDYTMEKIFFELPIPGEHNIENAKAAIAVASLLEMPRVKVTESLTRFSGTWRRSDYLGETKRGATVYDDYAHHPDAVRTTLKGFKERFSDKKLVVAFQPHLFSRTKIMFDEFVKSFGDADEIIILPIYAAREEDDPTITSVMLRDALGEKNPKTMYIGDYYELERHLNKEYGRKDLIITMGAGPIYQVAENLTSWRNST